MKIDYKSHSRRLRAAVWHILVFLPLVLYAAPDEANDRSTPASARPLNRLSLEAIYNSGVAKYDNDDADGAFARFNKVIELDPTFARAYLGRGNVRDDRGDVEGALADYVKALELDPRYAGAYNNRGAVRMERRDVTGAMVDFNKAIELEPNHGLYYRNRGLALAANEKWLEAYRDFDAAFNAEIQKDPGDEFLAAFDRFLAQLRMDEAAKGRQELTEAMTKARDGKADDWLLKAGAFLLGELSHSDLLKASEIGTPKKKLSQLSEAWFFAAYIHLTAERKEEAASCFRKSVSVTRADFAELELAAAELARLEAK